MEKDHQDIVACAALSAAWVISIRFIGLEGEFPISDDWAYAQTTFDLLETGEFKRVGWTWAPIISNVAIGATFASLFGASFEVLRASSAFMGWIGILGCFVLCRQLGATPRASAAAAALYGWNPLHFVLSFTFMTDVAFAALSTWSLVFLLRGLPSLKWPWIAGGLLATIIATLSRQLGLALPVAAAIAAIAGFAPGPRTLLLIGGGVAAAFGLFVFVPTLVYSAGDANQMFGFEEYVRDLLLAPHAVHKIVLNSVLASIYLGAFLAPLAFCALGSSRRARQDLAAGIFACGLTAFAIFWRDLPMPPGVDWIYDLGIGPLNLLGEENRAHLGRPAWLLIVGISSFAGGIGLLTLLRTTFDAWHEPGRRVAVVLLLTFPVVYFAVSAVRHPYFDRYLVPILPPLIALILPAATREIRGRAAPFAVGAAVVAAITLTSFALLGTRDYFELNRNRDDLLDELLQQGVAASSIDGGSEFNGWHNYHPDHARFISDAINSWVVDDEYVLTLVRDIPGYHAVDRRSYSRLLPPSTEVLTVQHRDGSTEHLHGALSSDLSD